MAGDLIVEFPDLLWSNLPRLRVSGSSPSRGSPQIDIIGMLEKASSPNFDHLPEVATDRPAAKQIKELNAEVLKLKWLLAEKEKLLVSPQPETASAGTSLPIAPVLASWKDKVVVNTSAPHMDLQFFAPSVVNEKIVVQPPEEVVTLGTEKWKYCVVGHFIDRKLSFNAVKTIAEKVWAKFGLADVLSNDEGFFFFQFDKVGALREVVEAGPWHFWGQLSVLKQWHPHMCFEKDQVKKIPIWAQFYNVPLDLWTAQGLSYVASAVGKPLYADQMTEQCRRLNYAKICVEVDVDSILPDSFDLILANGDSFTIKVWYPWKPLKCAKCNVFSHRTCQETTGDVPKIDPKQQVWAVKGRKTVLEQVVTLEDPNKSVLSDVSIVPDEGIVSVVEQADTMVVEIDVAAMPSVPVVKFAEGKAPGSVGLKAKGVIVSGANSSRNMFSVLQSTLDGDGTGGETSSLRPTEDEFAAGIIKGLDPIEVPAVQKGRVRKKKQFNQ
ncbi:hypothetical protein RHSIM_RhsimUnG0127000 [Rhododendron simsii]|uniref:DUF4283 domain-containing protein n=1 Tax=Rhododendron simsii TaxID=118357 RepID=A0A834L4A4_RHOSS|nr:hypothetical protein RHSIM_RhsimUnG0127000 [Rhododendron simsii]